MKSTLFICALFMFASAAKAQLVGSYAVSSGPSWTDDGPVYTCLEACAIVFGGVASDYKCSTDGVLVNNQAWSSSWGSGCNVVAEDYKFGTNTACGSNMCYTSAYVSDWCYSGETNYCFKASCPEGTARTPLGTCQKTCGKNNEKWSVCFTPPGAKSGGTVKSKTLCVDWLGVVDLMAKGAVPGVCE